MGKSQLKVIKSDGNEEEYYHTKVIGTISNALNNTTLADVERWVVENGNPTPKSGRQEMLENLLNDYI